MFPYKISCSLCIHITQLYSDIEGEVMYRLHVSSSIGVSICAFPTALCVLLPFRTQRKETLSQKTTLTSSLPIMHLRILAYVYDKRWGSVLLMPIQIEIKGIGGVPVNNRFTWQIQNSTDSVQKLGSHLVRFSATRCYSSLGLSDIAS